MHSRTKALTQREPKRTARPAVRLSAALENIVSRFDAPTRRRLRRLIGSSKRMADLAKVFPGAAYAIASKRAEPEAIDEALLLIEKGAPLKSVAKTLSLPMWLRKLPPEAFSGDPRPLPTSETFSRKIANRFPAPRDDVAFWLKSLSFATEAANEDFALWLAEQPIFAEEGDAAKLLPVLAAYAWYSSAPHTPAHSLIVVPWRPEIAFDTALCAAKSWFNRVRLVTQLDPGVITDPWLERGSARGFDFLPLTDHTEILQEAHAMQNCADQYADRLARDKCRLFSIRRGTARVATLEIGPHPRETGVLAVTQLKARHNMPASVEIWQAAHAWLSSQSGLKRLPPMAVAERGLNLRTWQRLMQAYREAKFGASWLPQRPAPSTFVQLDQSMADLARRAGVTSWLFT